MAAVRVAACTLWALLLVRVITGHLLLKAGYNRAQAQTGAVTLIQRFGSALNINIHFHMLFLDGVYLRGPDQHVSNQ